MFLIDLLWEGLRYLGLAKRNNKVLFVGIDNVGKTTLIHILGYGKYRKYDHSYLLQEPDLHKLFEEKNVIVNEMGLGGRSFARLNTYMEGFDGCVYMFDYSDESRYEDAKRHLNFVLTEIEEHVPVLIIGNKIDLKRDSSKSKSKSELFEILGLSEKDIVNGKRPIEVCFSSIVKRVGYKEGLLWLVKLLE